jgi:hypothetical protein
MRKGCTLLFGVCALALLLLYLRAYQPWLPYIEPEIQQALEAQFPHVRLQGFRQQTENCRIVLTDSDSLGLMYVMVQRKNGHWRYVDHAYEAGGLPPQIACPP